MMEPDTITTLLREAAILMLVGMIFVFAFLGLTIIGINLIARFAHRFPGPQPSLPYTKKKPLSESSPTSKGPAPHVIAAITAAVHQHRQAKE